MVKRQLAVVSGGLSQPSSSRMLADRLAAATVAAFDPPGDLATEVVELRDLAHDMADKLVTGFGSEKLESALETVSQSDGLIAVSPIFSASFSGLFKTFFDVLEPGSLAGKPVLLGATAGTPRHSLALEHSMRPLFAYLKAIVVPTTVFAATEDWGAGGSATDGALATRMAQAAEELADLVASTQARPIDPFADVTSMEEMLKGQVD